MKTSHLFWVVLFVCLSQSFFLIYLASNIRELENKVEYLSSQEEASKIWREERVKFWDENGKDHRLAKLRHLIKSEVQSMEALAHHQITTESNLDPAQTTINAAGPQSQESALRP